MPNAFPPRSFREVLGLWPGLNHVAHDLSLPYDRVAQWAKRNNIPSSYWPDLINAAAKRGFSFVSLAVLSDLSAKRWAHRTGERTDAA